MGDAAAVKAMQSDLLHALSSADRGGLVCAACNGVWICPQYKNMLYVCRGKVIGTRNESFSLTAVLLAILDVPELQPF